MKRLLILAICLLATAPAFAAKCSIMEFTELAKDNNGNEMPIAADEAGDQIVTYTTSTASAAFAAQVRYIRLICDAKAHFVRAAAPTATANSPWVAADAAEYFGVIPGQKIAFYDGTS